MEQAPFRTRKFVGFVAVVVGSVLVLWQLNRTVRDREAALTGEGSDALRSALSRVAHDPEHLAMTMGAGTVNERQLRRVNASIVGKVDVLVLGQSDADHMSQTFFRPGVRFYNSFISNSYFAYQYESYDELVSAQGAPQVVLFDVRSGLILRDAPEPRDDTPVTDSVWWAGPLFRTGERPSAPWYADVDSLLSLQQTEATVRWLEANAKTKAHDQALGPDPDTGAPFLAVDRSRPSSSNRWLADGSRVYPGEVNAVLVPRGQGRPEEATGARRVSDVRIQVLEAYVRRLMASGVTLILYAPPLQPRVFEDGTQLPLVRASGARVREVAERVGVDYCDLSTEAQAIGCLPGDFYDELHISRHCDQRIVRKLVTGCAPRAGAKLAPLVAPSVQSAP